MLFVLVLVVIVVVVIVVVVDDAFHTLLGFADIHVGLLDQSQVLVVLVELLCSARF